MPVPVPVPANEAQRLGAVGLYDGFAAQSRAELDEFARMAAAVCNAPAAAVSIVDADHLWLRGRAGLDADRAPRWAAAFCAHAIVQPSTVLVVPDATQDPRFADNPLVRGEPHVRFYAGMPLTTDDGLALGTLCVLDVVPRQLEEHQKDALSGLRRGIMALLEVRRLSALLAATVETGTPAVESAGDVAAAEARSANLGSVMDRISDGVVALDRDWRYVYANARGAALLGRTPQELIGQHIWTLYPEGIGQPFHRAYEKAFRTQRPVQLEEYYVPWNKWFENRIYPSRDGLTIFFTDTTESRHSLDAIRLSEARLRLATDASKTGLWDWDLLTNEVYFSKEWKHQIGYEESELTNQFDEFLSRLHPDDQQAVMGATGSYIADPTGTYEAEFRLRHRAGHYVWILTRAAVLTDANGRPVRMLGSHLDITARKNQELELERSKAELTSLSKQLLRAREEEAARISREVHDVLGQTLTTLRMDVGWLERRCLPEDTEVRQRLRDMGAAISQAVGEVRRIASALRPALLDDQGLGAAIEWIGREFQLRGAMMVRTEVLLTDEPPPEVGATIFRIVQEGLTNAAKHSGATHVLVRVSAEEDEWRLTVADDGVGLPRVAEPSDSRGLRGIRERARLLGGDAWVESSPTTGFTAHARIPRPRAA